MLRGRLALGHTTGRGQGQLVTLDGARQLEPRLRPDPGQPEAGDTRTVQGLLEQAVVMSGRIRGERQLPDTPLDVAEAIGRRVVASAYSYRKRAVPFDEAKYREEAGVATLWGESGFTPLERRWTRAYWAAISEYAVFFGVMAALLLLDWKKALLFFVIPQQFALFTIQVFNYVQHAEAATGSEWNHSRNFVSPVLNALLFNNGFHTVHHWKPGLHWTQTPAVHAEHAHKIHPELQQKSWWGYMLWTFFIRPFVPGAEAPDVTRTPLLGTPAPRASAS